MKSKRQGYSFNIRPLIFTISVIPVYTLCMTIGLVGYDKLAGELVSKFYIWATKG